jgi:hypothetical protein
MEDYKKIKTLKFAPGALDNIPEDQQEEVIQHLQDIFLNEDSPLFKQALGDLDDDFEPEDDISVSVRSVVFVEDLFCPACLSPLVFDEEWGDSYSCDDKECEAFETVSFIWI